MFDMSEWRSTHWVLAGIILAGRVGGEGTPDEVRARLFEQVKTVKGA